MRDKSEQFDGKIAEQRGQMATEGRERDSSVAQINGLQISISEAGGVVDQSEAELKFNADDLG